MRKRRVQQSSNSNSTNHRLYWGGGGIYGRVIYNLCTIKQLKHNFLAVTDLSYIIQVND